MHMDGTHLLVLRAFIMGLRAFGSGRHRGCTELTKRIICCGLTQSQSESQSEIESGRVDQ